MPAQRDARIIINNVFATKIIIPIKYENNIYE